MKTACLSGTCEGVTSLGVAVMKEGVDSVLSVESRSDGDSDGDCE